MRKSNGSVRAWAGAAAGLIALAVVLVCFASCETANGVKTDVARAGDSVRDATASLSGTPSQTYGAVTFKSEPDIRVRVAKSVTKKEIGGSASLLVRPVQTSPAAKSEILRAPVTVTSSAANVMVVDGSGRRHTWPAGTDLEILASDARMDNGLDLNRSLTMDRQRFPGFLTILQGPKEASTRFDVVVTMPVEAYLPGVVTNELLKDWNNLQVNEAQAVCARTYALHERSRARADGRPVDVENTTADQVYATYATSVATEAVRATRGMILTSEGKILRAYFSSTCGGRPASAADVWPKQYTFNLAKPLQGKPRQYYCQPSPFYRWQVTRNDDDLDRRIRGWGLVNQNDVAGMGRLRSVTVVERNDAGRPNRYKLTDDGGHEFMLKAEELRMACNHPLADLPPITRQNRVNSGDLEVEIWANQVRITGRGWGHGVGMCQWCAKGMAEAGMDWHTMLQTFYPGVEIQKAY